MRTLLLPAVLVVALVACGGDDDATGTTPAADATTGTTGTTPGTTGTTRPGTVAPVTTDEPGATAEPATSPPPPTIVESGATVTPVTPVSGGSVVETGPTGSPDELAAIADLARVEGVEESAVTVVSTQEVTWRDGSIGCPEPGMGYTQALVPGVRVILELDGVRFEYHAGGGRSIFLCDHPVAPVEG